MPDTPRRESQLLPLDSGNPEAAGAHAGNVVIHTHGCKLNQADSSNLARRFRQAGYRVIEDVREADIYVLNTCTVTATADSKARQTLPGGPPRQSRRHSGGCGVLSPASGQRTRPDAGSQPGCRK